MSEQNDRLQQAPAEGSQPASPATSPKGFERAENALAAGNEDSAARSREAIAGMENRPGEDRASKADEAGAVTRQSSLHEGDAGSDAERKVDKEEDEALDEKALQEGVEAAEDSSHVGWDLTPHNI
jgi:hypothetical protein